MCLDMHVVSLCQEPFIAGYTLISYSLLTFAVQILENRATTHTDLVVRAKNLGIDVKVVHNASIMNAVGICGLQLYRYGETVSIPFFTETWRPDSFYEKIQSNRMLGLHTLCLLGEIAIFVDFSAAVVNRVLVPKL